MRFWRRHDEDDIPSFVEIDVIVEVEEPPLTLVLTPQTPQDN